MSEVIKKVYLKEMNEGESIRALTDEKTGAFKLKVGKNVIAVKKDGVIKRRKVVIYTGDESKVQKSMQDETDIKNILAKYGRTGILPVMKNEAIYGDFSNVPEYQEAQNILIKAENQFNSLSSDVRKKFDNDPAKMLEFVSKEENLEEMYDLGLAVRPVEVQPQKVEVVNQQQPETQGSN